MINAHTHTDQPARFTQSDLFYTGMKHNLVAKQIVLFAYIRILPECERKVDQKK